MYDYNTLAAAASKNDSESESKSFREVLADLGTDPDSISEAAEQRALRVALILTNDDAKLAQIEHGGVSLSAAQRQILAIATTASLDGIAIGLRAAQQAQSSD